MIQFASLRGTMARTATHSSSARGETVGPEMPGVMRVASSSKWREDTFDAAEEDALFRGNFTVGTPNDDGFGGA